MARILIERDWIDRDFIAAHTSGFDEFAEFVEDYTLDRVAAETRLPAEAIEQFARTIHEGKRVSFWWTMGVNQSHQAVRTAQAIINLALMTGNIGRPGTGANSITGQCNAMGSRLFSNTTNLLGGHDFANAVDRRKVADVLDIDEAAIPREASWPYHRILEGILRGEIRGLWIVATNPAHSWINQGMARDVLERLDFLVVQDMYHTTETAQLAHLVLPAAGWGEKEGTFINSERRIGVARKVRPRPGRGARRLPYLQAGRRLLGLRRDVSPMGVARRPCSNCSSNSRAGQPCDITGIEDYEMLDRVRRHPMAVSGHVAEHDDASRNSRPATTLRTRAAALRRRPVLSRRRPRPIPLRIAATVSRAAQRQVPVRAAHRPRLGRPMAHANAHRKSRPSCASSTRTSSTSKSTRTIRSGLAFAPAIVSP